MEAKPPAPKSEFVTDGILPVQFFVARAIPLSPGTPARPRSDRPPFQEHETTREADGMNADDSIHNASH